MKSLTTLLTRALLIATLALAWTSAQALENFEQAGVITDIGISNFVVKGKKYSIAPGARLKSESPNRRKFSDFKKGDAIYFRGRVVGSTNYVDMIVYETPEPS